MADSLVRFAATAVAMATTTLIGLSIKSPQTPKHNVFIKQGNLVGLGNAAVRGTPITTHTIMEATTTTQAVTHTITQKIIQTVKPDAREVARELIHEVKTQAQSSASLFWEWHWATIIIVAAALIGFAVALSYIVTSRFFAKLLAHTLKNHILPIFEKFADALENHTLRIEELETKRLMVDAATMTVEPKTSTDKLPLRQDGHPVVADNSANKSNASEFSTTVSAPEQLVNHPFPDTASDQGRTGEPPAIEAVLIDHPEPEAASTTHHSEEQDTVEAVVVPETEKVDTQASSAVSSVNDIEHIDSGEDEESEDWETDIDEQDGAEEDTRGPAGIQSSRVKGFIGQYSVEAAPVEEDSMQEDSLQENSAEDEVAIADSVDLNDVSVPNLADYLGADKQATFEDEVDIDPSEVSGTTGEESIEGDTSESAHIPPITEEPSTIADPTEADDTADVSVSDLENEQAAPESPAIEDGAEVEIEPFVTYEESVEEGGNGSTLAPAASEDSSTVADPINANMFMTSSEHGNRRILPPVSRKRRSRLRLPDQVAQKDSRDETDSWNKTKAFEKFSAIPPQFLGDQFRDIKSIVEDVEESQQDEEVIPGIGKTIAQFSSSLIRNHLRETAQDKPPSQQIAKSGPASVKVQGGPTHASSMIPAGDQQVPIISQTPNADATVVLQENIHHEPTVENEESPATSATQTIPQLATQPASAPVIEPVLPQQEIHDVGHTEDLAGPPELSQGSSFKAGEEMASDEGTQTDPTEIDDQLNVTPPILTGTAATEKDFLKVVLDVEPPMPNAFLDNARWCLHVCEKYREFYLEPRLASIESDAPGTEFDIQLDAEVLTKFADIEYWEERKDKKTPVALRRVYENQLIALYQKWHTPAQVRGNLDEDEGEGFNIETLSAMVGTDRSQALPSTPVSSQMSLLTPLKLARGHRSVEEILADAKANGFKERTTPSSPRKVSFLMKNTPPRKMTESVEAKTRREAREALLTKEKQRADKEREENDQGKYGSGVRSWLPPPKYMASSQAPKVEESEESAEVNAATQSEQDGQVDRLDDAELDDELFGDSDEGEVEGSVPGE
jgi:hypothetical protein